MNKFFSCFLLYFLCFTPLTYASDPFDEGFLLQEITTNLPCQIDSSLSPENKNHLTQLNEEIQIDKKWAAIYGLAGSAIATLAFKYALSPWLTLDNGAALALGLYFGGGTALFTWAWMH